jgi:hypothetical protein
MHQDIVGFAGLKINLNASVCIKLTRLRPLRLMINTEGPLSCSASIRL